jgi:hypothetical protein
LTTGVCSVSVSSEISLSEKPGTDVALAKMSSFDFATLADLTDVEDFFDVAEVFEATGCIFRGSGTSDASDFRSELSSSEKSNSGIEIVGFSIFLGSCRFGKDWLSEKSKSFSVDGDFSSFFVELVVVLLVLVNGFRSSSRSSSLSLRLKSYFGFSEAGFSAVLSSKSCADFVFKIPPVFVVFEPPVGPSSSFPANETFLLAPGALVVTTMLSV